MEGIAPPLTQCFIGFLRPAFVLFALLLASVSTYADGVTYIERAWDSVNRTVISTTKTCSNAISVTSDMTSWGTAGKETWYVVDSDVSYTTLITVQGTVNLILADGHSLTATKGINVEDDNALNIYGQSAESGQLTVKEGLGGHTTGVHNIKISIHGGHVTSTGPSEKGGTMGPPACIGGYEMGPESNLSIYGGYVTALSNGNIFYGQTAIGGSSIGRNISIYGGTIVASGGYYFVGIGGATLITTYKYSDLHNVIYGGTVIAAGSIAFQGSYVTGMRAKAGNSESKAQDYAFTNQHSAVISKWAKIYPCDDHTTKGQWYASADNELILNDACSYCNEGATYAYTCTVPDKQLNSIVRLAATGTKDAPTVTVTSLPGYYDVKSLSYTIDGKTTSATAVNDSTFTFSMPKGNVTVSGILSPVFKGAGTVDNPYQINDLRQYTRFAQIVNSGDTTICGKLMADIGTVAEPVTVMIGIRHPYAGTFDGNGHKLYINYDFGYSNSMYSVAPFRSIAGATIKNLHTAGTIKTYYPYAAGIVVGDVKSDKRSRIENCSSDVFINGSYEGDCHYGGIAADLDDGADIVDCLFSGTIDASNGYDIAGIIADGNKVSVTNCLSTGVYFFKEIDDCAPITSRFSYYISVTNCHSYYSGSEKKYLSGTDDPYYLRNGNVLSKLGSGWAQILGTDDAPSPSSFYQAEKNTTDNLIYYDKSNSRWACNRFVMKDGGLLNKNGVYVKIGIDFTAKTIDYQRSFVPNNGLYTIYAPFAIPTTNGTFSICTGINDDKSQAIFSPIADAFTAPNQPYIFEPKVEKLSLGENIDVKTAASSGAIKGKLEGTYGTFTLSWDPQGYYYGYAAEDKDGYKTGAFVRLGRGATIPSGRAYLFLTDASSAKLHVVFGDATTGIAHPVVIRSNDDAPVYNLQGQQVDKNYKGIIIRNGKKFVRK